MGKELTLAKVATMTYEQIHKLDKCDLFYDWFCDEASLPRRAKALLKICQALSKAHKVILDPTKLYVSFQNRMPASGPCYDSIILYDKETGDTIYCISPKDTWYGKPTVSYNGSAEVDRFLNPLVFENLPAMKRWFQNPSEFATFPEYQKSFNKLRNIRIDWCMPIQKVLEVTSTDMPDIKDIHHFCRSHALNKKGE